MSDSEQFSFADELADAWKFCAAVSYIKLEICAVQPVPAPDSLSATVTFIEFENKTYAITARHVVENFRNSVSDQNDYTFFMPKNPGHTLADTFRFVPMNLTGRCPDIAFREIKSELPEHLGKRVYHLGDEVAPEPFPYALAVGFPTGRKERKDTDNGWQLAMDCVWATAHGVSTADGDQVQFFSEIDEWPTVTSLSGMSGGPVFWSDGDQHGLIGIVKEASIPDEAQESEVFGEGARVHFICQRITNHNLKKWLVS